MPSHEMQAESEGLTHFARAPMWPSGLFSAVVQTVNTHFKDTGTFCFFFSAVVLICHQLLVLFKVDVLFCVLLLQSNVVLKDTLEMSQCSV